MPRRWPDRSRPAGFASIGISQLLIGAFAAVSGIVVIAFVVTSVVGGSEDGVQADADANSVAGASGSGAATSAATSAASRQLAPTQVVVDLDGPRRALGDRQRRSAVRRRTAIAWGRGDLRVRHGDWSRRRLGSGSQDRSQVAAGLEIDGRFYGTIWSNSSGIGSYAEAVAGGTEFPRTSQQQPLVEPELWTTPDGRLAIHFPGPSPTGGSADRLWALAAETTLLRGGQTWDQLRSGARRSDRARATRDRSSRKAASCPGLPTGSSSVPDLGHDHAHRFLRRRTRRPR